MALGTDGCTKSESQFGANEIATERTDSQTDRQGASIGVMGNGVKQRWLETMRCEVCKWPKVGFGSFVRVSNLWFEYRLAGTGSILDNGIHILFFPRQEHLLY